MLRPVFDGLHPMVQRFCRRMLRNGADAEDATQVTLEKLFFKVSDFDARRDALGWALAMATAECRTLARKRFRRGETSDGPLAVLGVESEAERGLLYAEMKEALGDVLGMLKPQDAQTLLAWVELEPRCRRSDISKAARAGCAPSAGVLEGALWTRLSGSPVRA